MNQIMKEAKNKKNYEMFKLDPKEVSIIETLRLNKRKELNPNDPFFLSIGNPMSQHIVNYLELKKFYKWFPPEVLEN